MCVVGMGAGCHQKLSEASPDGWARRPGWQLRRTDPKGVPLGWKLLPSPRCTPRVCLLKLGAGFSLPVVAVPYLAPAEC